MAGALAASCTYFLLVIQAQACAAALRRVRLRSRAAAWKDAVLIEAFLDPLCPDSRDAWHPLRLAVERYSPLVPYLFIPCLPCASYSKQVELIVNLSSAGAILQEPGKILQPCDIIDVEYSCDRRYQDGSPGGCMGIERVATCCRSSSSERLPPARRRILDRLRPRGTSILTPGRARSRPDDEMFTV
ncbi:hypothetical protein ZWY2020_057689 [Hordeum vulgare]|nr:hypothetical protein ZWY2020_057689 [Hordeum vulgare]